MRLVRYHSAGAARFGAWVDGQVHALPVSGLGDLVDGTCPVPGGVVPAAHLLPPVPRPGKIFGSGINYRSHLEENPSALLPTRPGFFSKLPSSVTGPGASIRMPAADTHLDYEVELAVVIGRSGRDIPAATAMEHVLGYTVANDVSARDVQLGAGQVDLGKGCDTFCPLGPLLLTSDEVPDPSCLVVESWVNDERRQHARVAELLFDIPTLVSAASQGITLETGDVILTGTPAGSGAFSDPPRWLRPGDVVTVGITGLGQMSNRVVAGWHVLESAEP